MIPATFKRRTVASILRYLSKVSAILAGLLILGFDGAAADEVADFYRGRTVTIVVGEEAGTGFDLYGRALARHLGRHIPGGPSIVVQNMVGASGIVAANWISNIAPRDGTVLAIFVPNAIFEPLFGNAAAKFDPSKLTFIGNLDENIAVCGVSKASGIEKFDDLLVRETPFGSTGAAGPLGKSALAVKHLLGAKIRLVPGYSGSASVKLAINRGEVGGICGLSMSSVTAQWRDEYESGIFRPILQLSGKPTPALAGVPHVNDYAKSPEEKLVLGSIFGIQALGRAFVSPPSMARERMVALRQAFFETAKDPLFLDEALKTGIPISPMSGEEVESFVARVASSSAGVFERAKAATRND